MTWLSDWRRVPLIWHSSRRVLSHFTLPVLRTRQNATGASLPGFTFRQQLPSPTTSPFVGFNGSITMLLRMDSSGFLGSASASASSTQARQRSPRSLWHLSEKSASCSTPSWPAFFAFVCASFMRLTKSDLTTPIVTSSFHSFAISSSSSGSLCLAGAALRDGGAIVLLFSALVACVFGVLTVLAAGAVVFALSVG